MKVLRELAFGPAAELRALLGARTDADDDERAWADEWPGSPWPVVCQPPNDASIGSRTAHVELAALRYRGGGSLGNNAKQGAPPDASTSDGTEPPDR